jgi:segregation and condensation protein B
MEENRKLKSCLEALLLVSSKPTSIAKLAELSLAKPSAVAECLNALQQEYIEQGRGFILLLNNNQAQLVSSPEQAEIVKGYLKDDITGELSEPSLETLTIIAYRQPVSKGEMEQIRGVNCSLILRNLMIRGLIEADYDKAKGLTMYSVTTDFLKYLGVGSVSELPNFEALNSEENLQRLLADSTAEVEAVEDKVFKVEVTKE